MEDIESQLESIFNVTKLQRNKKLFWYMKKVYVDDVKITITAEEKDQIDKYSKTMDEYYAKVKEIKAKHRI